MPKSELNSNKIKEDSLVNIDNLNDAYLEENDDEVGDDEVGSADEDKEVLEEVIETQTSIIEGMNKDIKILKEKIAEIEGREAEIVLSSLKESLIKKEEELRDEREKLIKLTKKAKVLKEELEKLTKMPLFVKAFLIAGQFLNNYLVLNMLKFLLFVAFSIKIISFFIFKKAWYFVKKIWQKISKSFFYDHKLEIYEED